MAITAVGSMTDSNASGNASFTVSGSVVNDIRVLAVRIQSGTVTVSTVSGGGPQTSWTRIAGPFVDNSTNTEEIWMGVISETVSTTISLTYSGTVTTTNIELVECQFHSDLASPTWNADVTGSQNNAASTTLTYPSLTPGTSSGELYFGYCNDDGTAVAGGTTGFVYHNTGLADQSVYNVAVTATASPTATNTTSVATHVIAAIIADTMTSPKIFTSTGTITLPTGVSTVTAECWGGGGASAGASTAGDGGGGGAGGQYAKALAAAVTAGTAYTVTVGAGAPAPAAGANGTAGGDSWFNTATTVIAKGGAGGTANNGAGGAGSTTGGIGDTVFAGGSGAAGAATGGGGGGGGAGSTGAGGAASGVTAGTGTASGGGNGGTGAGSGANAAGTTGLVYGGGGGGAFKKSGGSQAGGPGAGGKVIISWTVVLGAPEPIHTTLQAVGRSRFY